MRPLRSRGARPSHFPRAPHTSPSPHSGPHTVVPLGHNTHTQAHARTHVHTPAPHVSPRAANAGLRVTHRLPDPLSSQAPALRLLFQVVPTLLSVPLTSGALPQLTAGCLHRQQPSQGAPDQGARRPHPTHVPEAEVHAGGEGVDSQGPLSPRQRGWSGMFGQGMGPRGSSPAFLLSEPQMPHGLGPHASPSAGYGLSPHQAGRAKGGHSPFWDGPGHGDQSQGLGRTGQPWAVPAGVRVGEQAQDRCLRPTCLRALGLLALVSSCTLESVGQRQGSPSPELRSRTLLRPEGPSLNPPNTPTPAAPVQGKAAPLLSDPATHGYFSRVFFPGPSLLTSKHKPSSCVFTSFSLSPVHTRAWTGICFSLLAPPMACSPPGSNSRTEGVCLPILPIPPAVTQEEKGGGSGL